MLHFIHDLWVYDFPKYYYFLLKFCWMVSIVFWTIFPTSKQIKFLWGWIFFGQIFPWRLKKRISLQFPLFQIQNQNPSALLSSTLVRMYVLDFIFITWYLVNDTERAHNCWYYDFEKVLIWAAWPWVTFMFGALTVVAKFTMRKFYVTYYVMYLCTQLLGPQSFTLLKADLRQA